MSINITLFNWVDYSIVAVIALSMLVSLVRGFVREAISLITWAIAFWVAFSFAGTLSSLLVNYIHTSSLRSMASFAFLFIITLLLGAFVNFLITQLVNKTGLSGTDRLFGILFGAARGILVVTLLLMLARLTPMPQEEGWKESILIPQFRPLETWFYSLLPKSVGEHLELSY